MAELKHRFRVTHPFHPLFSHQFDLVSYRRNWRREYIEYIDDDGLVASLPLEWTDVAGEDPFLSVSRGRSYFRVNGLLQLVSLIDDLSSAPDIGEDKGGMAVR